MRLKRRTFARSLAASGTALALGGCARSSQTAADAQTEVSLDALARAKGLRFGTALGILGSGARPSRFDDAAYLALIARECSVLVAENETKWPQLRPDPRQPYRFGPADRLFAWGRAQGMALRGHTLLWIDPQWLPEWVNRADFGAQPGTAAQAMLAEHVRSTCRHFGDAIESWDVVNEAVVPETGALRRNAFSAPLGDVGQIELAFQLAREHAPQAELAYCDFVSWGAGNAAHRAGVLALLTELKRRGAPVQALALQGHIGVWQSPSARPDAATTATTATTAATARQWRRFLDDVMALDLNLLVSEFDVNDRGLPGDIGARDAGAAAAAADWLAVTLDAPRLNRLLCWGLSDAYSWLQDGRPRDDGLPKRPLPYDAQLRPKPLRRAIADALRHMPARGASSRAMTAR